MDDTEEILDALTGRVLLSGAALGLIVAIVGWGMLMFGTPTLRDPLGDPTRLLNDIWKPDPLNLMEVGILILMVTPVAGIAALTVGFFWLGRLRFALVSILLLVLMIASFTVSAG